MGVEAAIASGAGLRRSAVVARMAVFATWLGLVLFLVSVHAFWRDEVRALSIALTGSTTEDMLRALQGEGHPAVWYLLLRGAYAAVGTPVVLPAVSVAVASAAVLMLLFVSPFRLWLVALLMFGGLLLVEYAVMARNYGLAVPLMFGFAALYRTGRERGVWLGGIAAILANTSAPAAMAVGGLMLCWLLDLVGRRRLGWNRSTGVWVLNGGVAAAGLMLCALTVYPPVNDAALAAQPEVTPELIGLTLALPGWPFASLFHDPFLALGIGRLSTLPTSLYHQGSSALMFGALLVLVRWPAGLIAALVTQAVLSLFYVLVYPASYRHAGLWPLLLVALLWMAVATGRSPRGWLGGLGVACLAMMAAAQLPVAADELVASPSVPNSRVADLAGVLGRRADLAGAVLIAAPDYLLEALPYYRSNPIYLPRSQRFGAYAQFTRAGRLDISLSQLLSDAQRLCLAASAPVVLVIEQDLAEVTPPVQLAESYNWQFSIDAASLRRLRESTEFLGRFGPTRLSETFGAYVLKPPCTLSD